MSDKLTLQQEHQNIINRYDIFIDENDRNYIQSAFIDYFSKHTHYLPSSLVLGYPITPTDNEDQIFFNEKINVYSKKKHKLLSKLSLFPTIIVDIISSYNKDVQYTVDLKCTISDNVYYNETPMHITFITFSNVGNEKGRLEFDYCNIISAKYRTMGMFDIMDVNKIIKENNVKDKGIARTIHLIHHTLEMVINNLFKPSNV